MGQYKIKGKLWMEVSGLHIGKGRVQLLEKIKELGSIAKAAQTVNISYRQAWTMINDMNKASKNKIVIKTIGGSAGGGTVLTTEGEILLKQFHQVEMEFNKFQKAISNKLNRNKL